MRPSTSHAMSTATNTREFEVHEASLAGIADALAAGRTTSAALVDAYLARIAAYDHAGPALNAIVRLNPAARADAEALDRERAERGPRGPLHGVPVLIKDNYEVAGLGASAGTFALAGWIPPRDAEIVIRLRAAGAIILGQTNMQELAHGITNISSVAGQTLNPYDPTRNPGGSSGGTGAAIAASFAAVGWGSDTCGSIRIPAAHNNLFGLWLIWGTFSVEGIFPLSAAQDVPGPLARTVHDLAIALDITAGPETVVPLPDGGTRAMRFVDALSGATLEDVRIGVLTEWFGEGDEAVISTVTRAALELMATHGAELIEVEIPDLAALSEGSSLITHDLKWDLNAFLAERPGAPVSSLADILAQGRVTREMEPLFRAREAVPAPDTEERRAVLAVQALVRKRLDALFTGQNLAAIAYPSVRQKAALIGEPQPGSSCRLSAASGYPAISIPAGFTPDGLPVGLELLGPRYSDEQLVSFARAYERFAHPRRAPTSTPPLSA